MAKREAEFGLLFRHWLRANPRPVSCAFELKQTTINSLPFSDVQEHQLAALLAVTDSSLLYKIPDDSRGVKPFDMVYLTHADAFVVIKYPDCFVLIEPQEFIWERDHSERKSLTSERAREICTVYVGNE